MTQANGATQPHEHCPENSGPTTILPKSPQKSIIVAKICPVPILPKQVPPAVTRVATLAPRPPVTPSSSTLFVSSPLTGTHNISSSNESAVVDPPVLTATAAATATTSVPVITRSSSPVNPNTLNASTSGDADAKNSPAPLLTPATPSIAHEKQRRNVRPRAFTEEDDLVLINFWASNYDIYCRVSKLAFARRATEYLNKRLAGTGSVDRSPTHEKQVHNKICYLLRRYESLLPKYYRDTPVGDDNAARISMITIDSEFPYFSKMFAFMSNSSNSDYPRKRKALRSSAASAPNTTHYSVDSANGESGLHSADILLRSRHRETANHSYAYNGAVTASAQEWPKGANGKAGIAEHSDENPNFLAENNNKDAKIDMVTSEPMVLEDVPNGVCATVGATVSASLEGNNDRDMKIDRTGNEDKNYAEVAGRPGTDLDPVGAEGNPEVVLQGNNNHNFGWDSPHQVYDLRKEELSLRTLEHKRLEAELDLRRCDFEHRRHETQSRLDMQLVHELRESAKIFTDLGMSGNAYKCMEKVAVLLKLQ